jgi:uncharacterized RDD family membrane protein YckC
MLALLIDLAAVSVGGGAAAQLLGVLRALNSDLAEGLEIVIYFVIYLGYSVLCEWRWRGQTVGKRLLRLRVVDAQNRRLEFGQVVVRNLLRFADALPALYLVGGVTCWLHPKRQRLGDIAAGTIVIRAETAAAPDLEKLRAGKYNSMAGHRHLAARLIQRTSGEVAGLALEAVLRREQLEPDARRDLFRRLAAYFQKLVPYPPEAVEQLSDEQYVRNAVEILYRAAKE